VNVTPYEGSTNAETLEQTDLHKVKFQFHIIHPWQSFWFTGMIVEYVLP